VNALASEGPDRLRAGNLLYIAAIFASAFLIFLIQPMVGKRIFPWFGGAPAVWTLCLAFYQTILFLGYVYAHCLIRYARPRQQLLIHAIVFAGTLITLSVLPDGSWKPDGSVDPSVWIALILTVNVAPPLYGACCHRTAGSGLVRSTLSRALPLSLVCGFQYRLLPCAS
jgi:hypothetical protein